MLTTGAIAVKTPRDIPIITATALKRPEIARALPSAKGDRRPLDERIAAAEREEAVSIALAQPHRRGLNLAIDGEGETVLAGDQRLATPLGRFCIRERLRGECYQAGDQYAEVLRQGKAARGLSVLYSPRGEGMTALTDQQLGAMREAAILRETKCRETLIAVHARAARVLEALCYDQRDVAPHDEGIAAHGLLMLAKDVFGLLDAGINRGKSHG